jgi:hypothetical protein
VWLALFAASAAGGETAGSVEFSVTTRPTDGAYAPRHVIAIWVTDGKGAFVKTLELCARKQKRHLLSWARSSNQNEVDAVTGATIEAHRTHTVRWDCRDAGGNPVPDGEYQIQVEFTEKNGQGPATPPRHIRFSKGPKALSLTFEELPHFGKINLQYTPRDETPTPGTRNGSTPPAG